MTFEQLTPHFPPFFQSRPHQLTADTAVARSRREQGGGHERRAAPAPGASGEGAGAVPASSTVFFAKTREETRAEGIGRDDAVLPPVTPFLPLDFSNPLPRCVVMTYNALMYASEAEIRTFARLPAETSCRNDTHEPQARSLCDIAVRS